MDAAIFRGDPEKVMLHISGTHGPEGFAGSAIQAAILDQLAAKPLSKDDPTVVFVHALNPYGFANNRRVNEDNVDLNRNYLTDEEFEAARARDPNIGGYVTHDALLNPDRLPSEIPLINDLWAIGRAIWSVGKFVCHRNFGREMREGNVGAIGKSLTHFVSYVLQSSMVCPV